MSETTAPRRVQRVRHETRRRQLLVKRVEDLSPGLRRITLSGDELAGFVSASFDDHVKLIFDAGDGAERPAVMRDYTPRRHDAAAGELDIVFALHGDGPAAAWATQAAPGQPLVVAGPRGSFVIPLDYDWHLLAGDETALPAIARRLEELPAGARVIVLLAVAPEDRRPLASAANVTLQWLDDDAALLAAVRALELPAGEGYAWCAGEAALMAELRRVLVDGKGHDKQAIRAAAYWKRGAIAHHETLDL
ncbi:siderophore-interacting protein [Aquincola sp. S2]|uniref:Siderophore-interacting protein n=1 Tax=Pseudaquabacterium terrae TaxID=2732868 RepID=A0ABX2ES69_9BURK|nr:siderophore-interacting protein [Aquabacterium terrae]NRF71540.1 siderophore-interacting protein [Aquabacterium terrae]